MGQFGEYIKMALYNLKENKGRSFLTMLGIIIGIVRHNHHLYWKWIKSGCHGDG